METKNEQHLEKEQQKDTKYSCPMKCDGDKIYNKPGDCPACNMHLVAVDTKNSNSPHKHCC